MRVHEVLKGKGRTVRTIAPDATVAELVTVLREHNLGALVVSSDGRSIEGIASERDVVRQLADGTAFVDGPVSAIMTVATHTCSDDDTVADLMSVMTRARIRHLPVVDADQQLTGIVSIGDVVKSTITQLEFERDQLEGYVTS